MEGVRLKKTALVCVLGLAACAPEKTGAPSPDAPGGSSPQGLAAPIVSSPSDGTRIVSPASIRGRGAPGATVVAVLSADDFALGEAFARVDAEGAFSLSLTFDPAPAGAAVVLSVSQTDGANTSPPALITVQVDTAPAAPTILVPAADADVASPVRVEGRGQAGATAVAVVSAGDDELGRAEAVVDALGAFQVSVAYAGAESGDALMLSVHLRSGAATSPVVKRGVMHRPRRLSGTVAQPLGPFDGTQVFVRLYESEDAVVDPLLEVQLTVAEDRPLEATPFSFDVADGRYFIRAYRDARGPWGGQADGHPTIPYDPQSTMSIPVQVSGDDNDGVSLVLAAPVVAQEHYEGFDVLTMHESHHPQPPGAYDEQREEWVEGPGLCRGYYLAMRVQRRSEVATSAPRVRRPDGSIVELADDGGCGDGNDNTASSYDDRRDDGTYTFGVPDPAASLAGAYTFFYRDEVEDLIHESVDMVASIRQLSRMVMLEAPTGAEAASTMPTYRWAEVRGAVAYALRVDGANGDNYVSALTTSAMFTASAPLPDDRAYRAALEIYDANPLEGGDIDASARSMMSFFITDEDADSTVVISGTIVNETGRTGAVGIYVDGDESPEASLRVPAGTSTYAIRAFARPNVRVMAFLDVEGAGEPERADGYVIEVEVDATTDATADLVFRAPVELTSPADGARGVGATPRLEWNGYGDHAPATWSYAVYVSNGDGDFPQVVYGLPPSATSFDFAMSAASQDAFDIVNLATGSPSASNLSGAEAWAWGLVVIECDHAASDYGACLMEVLGDDGAFYAQSPEWRFSP